MSQQDRAHTILELASQPAEAWRNYRWDSFTLVTPNWKVRMPGAEYQGDDPDGFMPREEVVAYLEDYIERFRLPILDGDGYPIQKRGITDYPGLYFVGLLWLHTAKSGLLFGVGDDAAAIVADISGREHR